MSKYKVLGREDSVVEVNGTEYPGGVGHVIELSDEEAATALADSKIELVADEATGEDAPAADAPVEDAADAPASDEAPADETASQG